MQLRLRTKLTLVMTGLVLLVVVVIVRRVRCTTSRSRFSSKPTSAPMKLRIRSLSRRSAR